MVLRVNVAAPAPAGLDRKPSGCLTFGLSSPYGLRKNIADSMNAAVIGQQTVVERLLIALLANGHVLMEGLPGTAKTRSIKMSKSRT